MQSTYRLKTPVFVSFFRDGVRREEAVRYLTVRGGILDRIGKPIIGEKNLPEKVEKFMAMLDLEGRGEEANDRQFLTGGDLDVAVDDAYRAARWRALDYIWGKNQVNDPAARCPRSFDAPSEAEAKACMMAAFGFDFTPAGLEDELA